MPFHDGFVYVFGSVWSNHYLRCAELLIGDLQGRRPADRGGEYIERFQWQFQWRLCCHSLP